MANGSEYELRLKAVLDTAEVQQKLQQLRGGQGAQGPVGSQSPAGAVAQQGNLGGLSQTLSKLNTGITQLRQSIDRLNGRFQGQFQQAQSGTRISSPSPIWGTRGGGAWVGGQSFIQQAYADVGQQNAQWGMVRALMTNDAERRKIIKNNVLLHDPGYKLRVDQMSNQQVIDEYIEYQKLVSSHRSLRRARLANSNMPSGGEGGGGGGRGSRGGGADFFDDLADVPNTAWNRFINPYVGMDPVEAQRRRRQNMRRSMGMWLGGMYASQFFAGAGKMYEGTQTASWINAAGEGTGSILNTASLLANSGSSWKMQAAVGALAGVAAVAQALVTQFTQLSEAAAQAALKIQEMKDAQTQQARELARGTETTIHSYQAGLIQERARDSYTSYEEDARVYQMTEDYRGRREEAMRRLAGMVDPMAYATQRRNSAEAIIGEGKLREGSLWHPYDQQEANQIREDAENDIKNYLQRYKNMQSEFRQMDQIFGTWNSALKEIERENMHLHELYQDEYTQFETEEANRVAANFSAMRDAEEVFGVKWARRSSTLDAQTFANETLSNRMLGPRGQFNALSQRLDVVRRSRNDALETAFGLNRRLGAGGLEEEEIMDLQKRRDEAQSHAAHWGDVAQILAHAMQQISTHVRPPDMSNVQDLGRWGMTFGERDNRTKVYEDYLRRQCNLQQEIRDKINEGVKSEARYE